MSAYATSTENRLRECLKAVQDVIKSNSTDKDCRTPIFGFAATSLLTLTFVILQDNVERKARNMGVWEVVSGTRTLRHKEPMDSARMLINNLKSKIRGQISKERVARRGDMLMPYLSLSSKNLILTFNENTSGTPLEIPETLFSGPTFSNLERGRYAAWRNTTHAILWAPTCNATPATQFVPNLWTTWNWLTDAEFVYAANQYGTPKQLLATRGPVFDMCDSMALGMAALRGNYTATSTDAEVRQLAEDYDVLVDLTNTNVTMLADHQTSTAVDKKLNDLCLLFFTSTFTPSILAEFKGEILREEWAIAYAAIVAQYSVNRPNEQLPTEDIVAAIKTLKHDPHRHKVAETLVVFDSLMVLLNLAHYVNEPASPRPGATLELIKNNLRLSLPFTDDAFSLAYPGVHLHVKSFASRQLLLGVFQGVHHFEHKVDDWIFTKISVPFCEIREGLTALESKPMKPLHPAPFAASASSINAMDPTGADTAPPPSLSAFSVHTQGGAYKAATHVPCVICVTNQLTASNGASHDAARCRAAKVYTEAPHLAAAKGFKSLHSLGLPSVDELSKLGDSLGPMPPSRARSPNDNQQPGANRFKRSPSPSTQRYPNSRARGNSQTGSRPNSRPNSRPTTPTTSRPNSPGARGNDRSSSSSGRDRNPRDSFLDALTNPSYMAMVKAAIEKSVDAAMNERK